MFICAVITGPYVILGPGAPGNPVTEPYVPGKTDACICAPPPRPPIDVPPPIEPPPILPPPVEPLPVPVPVPPPGGVTGVLGSVAPPTAVFPLLAVAHGCIGVGFSLGLLTGGPSLGYFIRNLYIH